jgi:hemoglobin-like flavoprotein
VHFHRGEVTNRGASEKKDVKVNGCPYVESTVSEPDASQAPTDKKIQTLTPEEALINTVRRMWMIIEKNASRVSRIFYIKFFDMDAEIKMLFESVDMDLQGEMLMIMVGKSIEVIDYPNKFMGMLAASGRRHLKYGVKDSHYQTVGEALLYSIKEGLDSEYTTEVETAWRWVYGLISEVMKKGAADARTAEGKHNSAEGKHNSASSMDGTRKRDKDRDKQMERSPHMDAKSSGPPQPDGSAEELPLPGAISASGKSPVIR